MVFKYREGMKVVLEYIAADATITRTSSGIVTDRLTDRGTGIIMNRKTAEDLILYQIALIDGRFDPHRNDLGELWANEFEIKQVLDEVVRFR